MTNDHLLEKVEISIQDQQLRLTFDDEIVNYSISTSKLGIGQQKGSNQTPLGWHQIRAKIGAGATENTVFIGRRPTGEIYSPELAATSIFMEHRIANLWAVRNLMVACG